MKSFEILSRENILNESTLRKKSELEKGDIMKKILAMKEGAEKNSNAIGDHLKNINEAMLITSLEDKDFEAFEKAFNGEWREGSEDFKKYMDDVLEWKKKERMDSGESPKLKIRRNFAAMIRSYVIDLTIKEKK